MRQIWWCLTLLGGAAPLIAQDCESVIALSKVVTTVVADRDSVEQHAANFCNGYSRSLGTSTSGNLGVSYRFLSATLGVANASAEAVAGRFCSAANVYTASRDAYKQYIEAISPNAYSAYEQCLRMQKQDLKFNVNLGSILPNQFSMSASFVSSTGQASAKVAYSTSKGVTCAWDGTQERTREIRSGSSAILECERVNVSQRSYVTLVRSDVGSGQDVLTLPWQAYSQDGLPYDSLAVLVKRIASLESRLSAADATHGKVEFQSGTVPLRVVGTPVIKDPGVCPDDKSSLRGDINARVEFPTSFASVPIVVMSLSSLNIPSDQPTDAVRLNVNVGKIDKDGFYYSFTTWCRTVVHGATASWFAISNPGYRPDEE